MAKSKMMLRFERIERNTLDLLMGLEMNARIGTGVRLIVKQALASLREAVKRWEIDTGQGDE